MPDMKNQIEDAFTYHPAKGDQGSRHESIRDKAKELANFIDDNCPDSFEKYQSLARLRETMMWANAAISCNE